VRVVMLGPPGVGKGTQGSRLARERGCPLISTGAMLREAAARRTPLGDMARQQMDAGHLVSDDVMIGLVQARTQEADAERGFVLDGFPRTVPQAESLDVMLKTRGQGLDAVVRLVAPAEELVRRMSRRRECPVCHRIYNLETAPSRVADRCDDHPETVLVQRVDDAEATVRTRLTVYEEQTAPLAAYYRQKSRLIDVDGTGSTERVYQNLVRALHGAGVTN
jgi:adenylate kinase